MSEKTDSDNNAPPRTTAWHKINYLTECFDDLDINYIRFYELETYHIIVNDLHKWAYLVHDPGVVFSEISLE